MRTTKRFTPNLLDRWEKLGRGTGTGDDYQPWHQVSRGDPASGGLSHLLALPGSKRFMHLLSNVELKALYFVLMLPDVIDVVEQFPLAYERAPHELGRYSLSFFGKSGEGTSKIAADLGIKHPMLRANGDIRPWTPSTDLLVVTSSNGIRSLLAIADKETDELKKRRKKQLMSLERDYWLRRGAEWLLFTPDLCNARVGATLSRTACWALSSFRATKAQHAACAALVKSGEGKPVSRILEELEIELGTNTLHAQCALWQSVWTGSTPLDLRIGYRPDEPVRLLSRDEFISQNPIMARRSAWPNT